MQQGQQSRLEVQEFEVDHLDAFQENGWEWPPALDTPGTPLEAEVAKKTSHHPRRRKEIVYFQELRHGDTLKEGDAEFCCDTNLNLKWTKNSNLRNIIPCLVATSHHWLLRRGRGLSGPEALSLQGVRLQLLRFSHGMVIE